MADLQKRLAASPDWLSEAEAQKRLPQYGPNELEEKQTDPFLNFLSYFWGPTPWISGLRWIRQACMAAE